MDLPSEQASQKQPESSAPGRFRRAWGFLTRALASEALSSRDRRIERFSLIVATIASVWFLLVAAWEIAGPFGAGHVASTSAMGLAAENMWKWKILGPVTFATLNPPTPNLYYCNHPWGTFWTTAIAVKIFGHHDFACRLPPIVMSGFTPPLLYGIGRRMYGPIAGALAAVGFVVLPIALAFANFNALEVPVIFGVCLAIWGYLRMTETWRRRWVAVSAFGLLHAFNSDWAAYFFGAVVLAFMLFRGILFNGRWYPPVDRRRFAQWWALASSAAVGVMLFYIWQFQKANQLGNLLTQGIHRSAGNDVPLDMVLEARAYWIELAFTPLAIFIGKLAVPLLVFRWIFLRKDNEIFTLGILFMATAQYVIFKQGADIHFFWPHYFAPYFALALAAIAGSLEGAIRAVVRRFKRQGQVWPPIVAFSLCLWIPLSIIPDGITGLLFARRTGGRYDERGDLIHQDIDKISVLKYLKPRFESGTSIGYHEGMKISWHMDWATGRPSRVENLPATPAAGDSQYYVLDARFIYAADLKRYVDRWHVEAYGPFWFVDRSAPKGFIDGFALEEREPKFWEWYFLQGTDPIYKVVPDPFVTWELRYHFDQKPNPPGEPAVTFEQKRIAHNVAVANGDTALADRLRQELESELDKTAAADYSDGSRLLGTRLTKGVAPKLSVYFRAAGPITPDAMYYITTQITADKRWSWVAASTKVRNVGMPFELPTPLWKAGFIYRSVSEVRPRPGTEKFTGVWGSRTGNPKLPSKPNGVNNSLLLTTGS